MEFGVFGASLQRGFYSFELEKHLLVMAFFATQQSCVVLFLFFLFFFSPYLKTILC